MNVIAAILFFICFSFIIVIFGVVVLALFLKSKMTIFKQVQTENESYHNEPYVDADFYSIGHDEPMPESFTVTAGEIIDTTYRVIESDEDNATGTDRQP